MIRKLYNVVFYGEIAPGYDLEEVQQNLMSRFNLSLEECQKLFTGDPVILREEVDYHAASMIESTYKVAGLECQIELVRVETEDGLLDITKYCQVEFKGEIAVGHHLEEVKKNLAAYFKIDIHKIDQLFTGKPVVIKKDVDFQTALDMKTAFKKLGAICTVKSGDKLLPQYTKPPTIICPKCGFKQEKAPICTKCGVVIQKYLQKKKKEDFEREEPQEAYTYQVGAAEAGSFEEHVAKEEPIEEEPTPMWQIWVVGSVTVALVLSVLGVSFRETVPKEFLWLLFENFQFCSLLGLIFPCLVFAWRQGRDFVVLRSILVSFFVLPTLTSLIMGVFFNVGFGFWVAVRVYKVIGFSAIVYFVGFSPFLAFKMSREYLRSKRESSE